jgi:hypothetical protein
MQIFGVLPVSNCTSPQTPHNNRAGIGLPSTSFGQPPTYLEKYEEVTIDNDVQDEGVLTYLPENTRPGNKDRILIYPVQQRVPSKG